MFKVLFVFFFLVSTLSFSETQEELFEKAFGRELPSISYPMSVTLYIDGVSYSDINVIYAPYQSTIELPVALLDEYLPDHMEPVGISI
jgi:hypothetical protein